MKHIVSIILALVLISILITPVLASDNESTINPRYSYVESIYSALSISKSGIASCQSIVYVVGGDHIKLTSQLQRYNGSSWSTIKTWTKSATQNASLSNSYAVYSGYKYRVRTICDVYNSSGARVESASIYSNQVTH